MSQLVYLGHASKLLENTTLTVLVAGSGLLENFAQGYTFKPKEKKFIYKTMKFVQKEQN